MATQEQIDNFRDFAAEQLNNGGAELSMDELYGMWRAQNPTTDELLDSVAAVKSALSDMEEGDTGIPAEEHLAKLRNKYSIAETE